MYISHFFEFTEQFDVKNGMDVYADNGDFILLLFGQGYEYKNEHHIVTIALKLMPYDSNRNFIKLVKTTKDVDINEKIKLH